MTPNQLRAIASIPARFAAMTGGAESDVSRALGRSGTNKMGLLSTGPKPLPAYRYLIGFNPIFYRLIEGLKSRGFIDGTTR